MGIKNLVLCFVFNYVQSENYYERTKIFIEDGDLHFSSPGNIKFSTQSDIAVNNLNLLSTLNKAYNASKLVEEYQKTFSTYVERIEALEEKSVDTISNGNNSSVSVDFVQASIRRINRRLLPLQRRIGQLQRLLGTNECLSNPCKNGGVCQDIYNGYLCLCSNGWEGLNCDIDVNECARFTGTDLGCQNGATCLNKPGTYQCLCQQGWFGIHCTRRSTDCTMGSAELCGHGTCVPANNNLGYKCLCDEGWKTDGSNLACNVDVDECKQNHPSCSKNPMVSCINVPGSYFCGPCPQGYTGNGYYCTDIDECSIFNGGCSVNPMVRCINTPGSKTCGSCPPGYSGDGTICLFLGVCQINNGGCHYLAQCRDNPRISTTYVECICPTHYIGNGIGPNGCVPKSQNFSPCNPNPCVHGSCVVNNNTNDYICNCRRKYTGRNCDIYKDPCVSSPCQNGGTCQNIAGITFVCQCLTGFTGNKCEVEREFCGGVLASDNGTMEYPAPDGLSIRSQAVNCVWLIKVNSSKVLNVTFEKFEAGLGLYSTNCRAEFLQMQDGSNTASKLIGRFCGKQLPLGGNFMTSQNLLYVWLKGTIGGYVKFKFRWNSAEPSCGGHIENTLHGRIESPGSPGNYPVNRDCHWTLIAPEGKRFLFHFYALDIGENPSCQHDFLEFYDMYDEIRESAQSFIKYCNTTLPQPLYSPGRVVSVHFHSDEKNTYKGFQITYSVVEGIPGCGGTFTINKGILQSPTNIPENQENVNCEYRIKSPAQSRVKITFLELKSTCPEGPAIYEGPTEAYPLIGRYCGEILPGPFISHSNEITILTKANTGTWKIEYERECHQTYTERNNTINIPSNASTCTIEIQQPEGYVIIMDVIFDMIGSIEIYDGDNENSPLLKTLVGTNMANKANILSSYNQLLIKTQNSVWNKLEMSYTSINIGCGGILKEKIGSIKSPTHPSGFYPPKHVCRWIVKAPPGYVIRLTWLTFHLEESFSCSYDNVQVFDNNTDPGMGGLLGTFCGYTLPPSILSSSNIITVVFKTDESVQMDGFSATYIFLQEKEVCGGNYFTSAGVVRSPGYPTEYPTNRVCAWTITVPQGQQIVLNVTNFELENNPNCRYDFLEIRNGGTTASPLIGRYCDTTIPKQIPSQTNKMFLLFESDISKTDRGFEIYWTSTSTGCGGTLTSPSGTIISPNYPEPYDRNTDCMWRITVNAGSKIQAIFGDIDLEDHQVCVMDYVQIFDGSTKNSKSLGTYCSAHQNSPVLSSKNNLLIRFRSDISEQGRGFQLVYSTVCNNTLTGFRGVIESPNFPNGYPTNQNCHWNIIVPTKNKINITFSHFDIENSELANTTNCLFDYVEIKYYEPSDDYSDYGELTKDISLGKYCGKDVPEMITINSSHVEIIFFSDSLMLGNGFRLEWQLFGCGGILSSNQGTIESPNYPRSYPDGIQCDWQIEVEMGYSIQITFLDLNLESSEHCSFDYIEIFNDINSTDNLLAKLCFQDNTTVLTSNTNKMYIQFISDISHRSTGFKANYTIVPSKCGGKMRGHSGTISSPNYPALYDKNDICSWEVEVKDSHAVQIKFESMHIKPSPNCTESFIKIFDGPSEAYPILITACDTLPNNTVVSSYNHVFIQFKGSRYPTKGFMLKFSETCGSRISTQGSGLIETTAYRSFFEYEQICTWIISAADPSQHVALTITYMDDNQNYVSDTPIKIYDGEFDDSPLIGEYKGNKPPPTLYSDGSVMKIALEGTLDFTASYTVLNSQCGGTLISFNGYFSTPRYPKQYPSEMQCEWTLPVAPGNHITLSFINFDIPESNSCNDDFVEIRSINATGKVLGVFCGQNIPTNITEQGSLWILFKSSKPDKDADISSKGFYAEYSLDEWNALTGPKGVIATPLYPKLITNSLLTFHWKITVSSKKKILLTFKDFYLDYDFDAECFSSILEIFDGVDTTANSLGSFCGSTYPQPISSSSNIVFIRGDFSKRRLGARFLLEWLEISGDVKPLTSVSNKVSGCGSTETINLNPYVTYDLTSPGYPRGYAPMLKCEWVFSTIPINHIHITFYTIDFMTNVLYGSKLCNQDYIELYSKDETSNSDWKLIQQLCKNENAYYSSYSGTNLMKVVFKTNSVYNGTGFAAKLKSVCGGTLDLSTNKIGRLFFDNITVVSPKCQWNITAHSGRTIKMEIEKLDVNTDETCSSYLMVRNGKFPDSPLLGKGKYCGRGVFEPVSSTGNYIYMKYYGLANTGTLSVKFEEESQFCGGEIRLSIWDNSTEISSPNYPNIPLPHTECIWIIAAPPGESLEIDFEGFDLANCTSEYIELRDGATMASPLINRFCGDSPSSQYTTDNMLHVKFFTDIDDPSTGFKAKVKITTCGGTLRDSSGTIKSPQINNALSQNCTWHIIAPSRHYLTISFTRFDLGPSTRCPGYSHTVYISEVNDINKNLTLLSKKCGNAMPFVIKTSTSEAVIVYEHNPKVNFHISGFTLSFNASEEICGGYLTQSQGIITSPGYPVMNFNARSCQWKIEVPKGRRVTFELLDFDLDLEPSYTRLILFDGSHYTLAIAHLKPGDVGKTYESSDNKMSVFFSFYRPSAHRGFKAKFSSDHPTACSGDFNKTEGTLVQPTISRYMCQWVHNSYYMNETLAMSITLMSARKVNSPNCKYVFSSIRITNQDNTLYILCKSTRNSVVVRSPFPITKIQAKSSIVEALNFTIAYSTHPCGGIVTSQQGYISSPNFPNKPKKSIECAWLLQLDAEQRINVTIQNISIGRNCTKSFVSIYNGKLPSDPRIHQYCQNNIQSEPNNIISQSNYLLIEYKYEDGSNGNGFNMTYEAIDTGCGGIFHKRSRIIESPSYGKAYPNNAECLWEIRSNSGYCIKLNFIDRFFIADSDRCEEDFIETFDWRENKWVSIGKICGRNPPESIRSTGEKLKILFRTNEKISASGFKAKWEWQCGGTFEATDQLRYIVSPGYPDGYEGSITCVYNITSKDSVNIVFEDFELEDVDIPECKFDNLTIHSKMHLYSRSAVYCGSNMPPPQRTKDYIIITFMADKYVNRKGFKFSYRNDNCGGEITKPGLLTEQSFNNSLLVPLSYRPFLQRKTCIWKIRAPPDQIVVLSVSLNMNAFQNCFLQKLEVFKSWNATNKNKLVSFCGNINDIPTILSDSNEMLVRLDVNLARFSYLLAGVDFAYGRGCGGSINLTTPMTIESSNNIPRNENSFFNCYWQIRAPRDYRIKIELPYVATVPCKSCWKLEIRDGGGPLSEIIANLKSVNNSFSGVTTSWNLAYIRFSLTGNFSQTVFTARLTPIPSECGHSIINVTRNVETLQSPGYPNSYPSDITCNWVFYSKVNEKIVLHFEDFDIGTFENGTQACVNDKLQIIEDPNQEVISEGLGPTAIYSGSDNRQSVYKFYRNIHSFCGKEQPFDYYPEGKSVTVSFQSKSKTKNSKGFKLHYSLTGCNRNYTSIQGRIVNVNSIEKRCTITIEVIKNRTISLFLNYLFFSYNPNCSSSGFEVRDGGPAGTQLFRTCGIGSLMPIFSFTNKIWINTWNEMLFWSKYDITYTSTDKGRGCGGYLYNYKGKFSSPLYPLEFRNNTMCTWDIEVPRERKFQLSFQTYDIRGPCDRAYLEVDTFIDNVRSTHKFCSEDKPATLESQSKATVRLQSFVNNGGFGFQATFETIEGRKKIP